MATANNRLLLDDDHPKPSLLDELIVGKKPSLKLKPSITPLPKSHVLGKVKDFLGVMAKANEKLEQKAKESSNSEFDIEVLKGAEREYIEMDLILGVAELNNAQAIAAAEATMSGLCPPVSSQNSSSFDTDKDDDDDDDDDDSDDDINGTSCQDKSCSVDEISKNDKSLAGRKLNKRPKITVLDQTSN